MKNHHLLVRGLFAFILIAFLMPFVNMYVDGFEMTETGVHLATGAAAPAWRSVDGKIQETYDPGPQPFAVAAVGVVISGLIIAFVPGRLARVVDAVAASGAALFLLLLKIRIDDFAEETRAIFSCSTHPDSGWRFSCALLRRC